jgi:predicted esterase
MRLALALAPVAMLACAAPVDGPTPLYAPGAASLTDSVWPTDDRRTADGLDLSGFPTNGVGLLEAYVSVGQTLPGWGSNGPVFFPLDGELPAERLPDPADSVDAAGGVLLLPLDPDAPGFAEPVPVQWEVLRPGTLVPHPTLAVAPVYGFPLAPGVPHALVLTTDVVAPAPGFAERLAEDPALDALRPALRQAGLPRRRVAVATVFTPRDPLAEMDRLVAATRAEPALDLSQPLTADGEPTLFYRRYEAEARLSLWQHGDRPYASEGGAFRFGPDGTPERATVETIPLTLSTPLDLGEAPEDGWPVVLYAHGTGGSRRSFANGGSGLEPASQLARGGFVGISFDQPLHGSRATEATNPDLHSFNYLNPTAARANFRQGALDLITLVDALTAGPTTLTTPDGTPIRLDPDRVLFYGHSHGGLTGAMALPWLGDRLRGAVLSGAGGGLAISVVVREDPVDIADLIETVLGFGPDESLTPLHPAVGLVQLLVEETDPLNYAPFWAAQARTADAAPVPVLLTSGRFDLQTDHRTAEALAAAGRLPQVDPAWNTPDGLVLRGLEPLPTPVRDNIPAFDGTTITGGLSQFADGDHFVVFREPDAASQVLGFLESAADGAPAIPAR